MTWPWWWVWAASEEVDEVGLIAATRRAMRQAIDALGPPPDHLLIDHLRLTGVSIPQTPLTHGDARSLSIAAASVMAKVSRDRLMAELELAWPGYAFAVHKGYGTRLHQTALARLGPSPVHRRTYAPIALRLNLNLVPGSTGGRRGASLATLTCGNGLERRACRSAPSSGDLLRG